MSEQPQRVVRPVVPALEELLGKAFPVLDDGFIRLVDYMGDDGSIVQAARVSYGQGTRKVSEDRGLIRYLLRHRHTTPFEMCEVKFHVRVPMDCWRQWIRHRTANVNEYSTRYSIAIDRAQTTEPGQWRKQASNNKQGSDGFADTATGERMTAREAELQALAREVYDERLELGLAREQARKDLPLSTYTEAYWKVDLHNLLHFLALRMDPHAQQEIRQYATVIGEQIVAQWVPIAWEAFEDYRMGGAFLTRIDREIFELVTRGEPEAACRKAEELGILSRGEKGIRRNRERSELETKLKQFGLSIPWADQS